MQRTIEFMSCLNFNYVFLEVDQAIYNKVQLDNGNLACENMVNSVLNKKEKGEKLLQEFISNLLVKIPC